jgi:hypothetical protein
MRKPISAVALSALLGAGCAGVAFADEPPQARRGLRAMLCTQEAVSKGYDNRELEVFVDRCLKAGQPGTDKLRQPGDEKARQPGAGKPTPPRDPRDDSDIAPEMANC